MIYLRRLFQPHIRAFWLMVALNALSAVLLWITRSYPLTSLAQVVFGVFALGNAFLGFRLAWHLVSIPPH